MVIGGAIRALQGRSSEQGVARDGSNEVEGDEQRDCQTIGIADPMDSRGALDNDRSTTEPRTIAHCAKRNASRYRHRAEKKKELDLSGK